MPFVPISVAYGAKCLAANAHPYWILVINTALAGPSWDLLDEGWQQMITDTLAHLGKTKQVFDADVAAEFERLEAAQ